MFHPIQRYLDIPTSFQIGCCWTLRHSGTPSESHLRWYTKGSARFHPQDGSLPHRHKFRLIFSTFSGRGSQLCLRLLANLFHPAQGSAHIFHNLSHRLPQRTVSALPDNRHFPDAPSPRLYTSADAFHPEVLRRSRKSIRPCHKPRLAPMPPGGIPSAANHRSPHGPNASAPIWIRRDNTDKTYGTALYNRKTHLGHSSSLYVEIDGNPDVHLLLLIFRKPLRIFALHVMSDLS